MLDKMRKHSRSFLIYIFFGIIIAVFVVNFGPQSSGCVAETTYAGQIDGQPLSLNDLNYAMAVVGLRGRSLSEDQMVRLRAIVVDRLIVRELLANRARDRGLRISGREINDMLLTGRYLALGEPRQLFQQGEDFDYDYFSRYVRYNWGITVLKFEEQQRHELLAEKIRLLMRTSTKASSAEVEREYRHENTRADLQYVRFDPADFRSDVQLDNAAVQSFSKKNTDKIKQRYQRDKARYTNLPEQLRVQMIALDWDKAGDEDTAQRKATQIAKQLQAGGDFTSLASKHSDDASAGQGGLIDWKTVKALALGSEASAALAKMKDGDVSAPLTAQKRTVVLKLVGRRKGDVPLEQARAEIARALLVEQQSAQLAQQAATALIQKAKQGTKLEELVPADKTSTGDSQGQTLAPTLGQGTGDNDTRTTLQTTGPFAKSFEHLVPGIGISQEISRLAFSLAAGSLADKPLAVANAYYVVAIKERREPDMAAFNKRADELTEQYQDRKAGEALRQLELKLCEEAVKERRLTIDARVLAPADPGDPAAKTARPVAYVPCQTLRMM